MQEEKIEKPHPLRVLIVDDDPVDADLLALVLQRAGYAFLYNVVASRERFEQRLETGEIDLILCDHTLVSWTGLEALEILRRSQKDIPFVLVTATLADEAAVQYIQRGAADYVMKHRLDRLPAAVDRVLREKQHREEKARLQKAAIRSEGR